MLQNLKSLFLIIITLGCTSPEHQVTEIDTQLDVKGTVNGSSLGLNEEGQAILQTETSADTELRNQIWENNDLESKLYHEYHMLKWCRKDIADPRLGGQGEITKLPEIDDMKTTNEYKEEFGLDGNRLKVVKKEQYVERLKSERKYFKTLKNMTKTVKRSRENCELLMGSARIKAGLPAKRYQGKVSLNDDGTVDNVIHAQEKSLDDAFRFLKLQKRN